ncbi:hybrid sensor histidine kinase/response regulator [Leptospira ilyithenensis]|uniref:histidine kinase n=1 Tax=Leptospira ilyithenensis TaxID=2484901 RepID=A0A4V3JX64_9LEPT|nr:response regulator [Leptospira ilyithenensis]TGN11037.1 response regulator [Leptospira ilyithenensis]
MSKILVIDDEEEIRIALKRVLTREGYEVVLSASVLDAIEKVDSNKDFSLVISDIMMKGKNGIDFIQYVSESNKNLPVILITGNPNLATAESAVRFKAFEYISKPVDRFQILSVVKRAIDSKTKIDVDAEKLHQSEIMEKVLRSQYLDLNRQNAAILNATSDAVITIDFNKTIVFANFAAFEMFHYPSPADLIGQTVQVLFTENKMDKYIDRIQEVMGKNQKKQAYQQADVTLKRSDETTFVADVAICTYILDGESYFTGVIRDVTQKKMMVEQLIDSERRAFLSTVAASIGHEINNSLTAIQGFVEMATKETAEASLKDRALQVTLNQTQKLQTLTSNLLQLGKSSKTRSETIESIDVNKVVSHVLEVFKETARLKYCQINWEPGEKLSIKINPDQFSLLLSNILLNAADATKNTGTISIQAFKERGSVHLSITDDGYGMTEEVISKIYEPYFTTKELGRGTGLGMFVVKQIIDSFGIKLTISSEPEKGSVFTFIFSN